MINKEIAKSLAIGTFLYFGGNIDKDERPLKVTVIGKCKERASDPSFFQIPVSSELENFYILPISSHLWFRSELRAYHYYMNKQSA